MERKTKRVKYSVDSDLIPKDNEKALNLQTELIVVITRQINAYSQYYNTWVEKPDFFQMCNNLELELQEKIREVVTKYGGPIKLDLSAKVIELEAKLQDSRRNNEILGKTVNSLNSKLFTTQTRLQACEQDKARIENIFHQSYIENTKEKEKTAARFERIRRAYNDHCHTLSDMMIDMSKIEELSRLDIPAQQCYEYEEQSHSETDFANVSSTSFNSEPGTSSTPSPFHVMALATVSPFPDPSSGNAPEVAPENVAYEATTSDHQKEPDMELSELKPVVVKLERFDRRYEDNYRSANTQCEDPQQAEAEPSSSSAGKPTLCTSSTSRLGNQEPPPREPSPPPSDPPSPASKEESLRAPPATEQSPPGQEDSPLESKIGASDSRPSPPIVSSTFKNPGTPNPSTNPPPGTLVSPVPGSTNKPPNAKGDMDVLGYRKTADFVVSKLDYKQDPVPALWRIDGKSLLQKYLLFIENGNKYYKNSSTYSCRGAALWDQYYPAPHNYIRQGKKETVVELKKEEAAEWVRKENAYAKKMARVETQSEQMKESGQNDKPKAFYATRSRSKDS